MKYIRTILSSTITIALVFLLLASLPSTIALADSAGPLTPGAGANQAGIGTELWTNPGEITTLGSPYATAVLYHGHLYSNYLRGSQYGFNIPTEASITGIEVTINRFSDSKNPNIVDNVVRLVDDTSTIVGENKAVTTTWPIVLTSATYGGPTNLWGYAWTPAIVNSPNFGVVLAAYRDNKGNNQRQAAVDTMWITVYYAFESTLTISCGDGSDVVYGDTVTCTATVTRLTGSQQPDGLVSWATNSSGTFDPNPCTLSGADGVASCTADYTPSAVGTGTHRVTASYDGGQFFNPETAWQDVSVVQRPVTVTADAQTKVFGDPDPEFTYTYTPTLVFNDAFTGTLSRDPGEDVGQYAITKGTLAITPDYDLAFVGNFLDITPAEASCSVIPYTVTYDGTAHTATGTCTGLLGEDLAGLDLGGTVHTDAGVYTDSWQYVDETGNYLDQSGTVVDTVDKADAACTVIPYDVIYDGQPHTATGSCTGMLDEELTGLDLSATTHTEAGMYTDAWTFSDANYNDQNGTVDDTIRMLDALCTVEGWTGVYDGQPHGATGECLGTDGQPLAGLDLGDTFTNVPGGTADWTFIDPNGDYTSISGSVDVVITEADAACTVDGWSGVYDGDPHSASGECLGVDGLPLEGLDLGDGFTNVPGGTADWAFTDQTGNYNDAGGSVDIVISKADAACAIDGWTGAYDAYPHSASGECLGVDDLPLAGLDLGASFTDVPGGTASWTFTDTTGNYNDNSGSVDITITKADATCNVLGWDGIYDGYAHSASGDCLGVDELPLPGLDLGASFTNVPGGTASWTFTDTTGNYNDNSGSVDITISKANATCTVLGWSGMFDGNPHAASGECLGVDNQPLSGLDLGAAFTNVPGGTAVWAFTDTTGNYNDDSGSVDIAITRADAACNVTGWSGVYDGNPHSASGECLGVDGLPLAGLDLGAAFTNVPGGTANWTFTDVSGNYNDMSGSVDIVISKADPTCTVEGWSGVYDGTPHSASGECLGVDGLPLAGLDLGTSFTDVPGGTAVWAFTDATGNYTDASGSADIVIGKADATCAVTPYSVEFDRLAHTATGSCLGVLGEDLAGLDLGGTTHTDVGSYQADPWTFTDATGNYNDASGTVDDLINKRLVTITADAKSKAINKPDPVLTYQVTAGSLLEGDTFSGTLTRTPGENPGKYAILLGTLALPDYYEITFVGADFTIIGNIIYLPVMHRY